MFNSLKKAFGAGAKEIKNDYSGNKDFLEAVCAASALVAAADGDIEESERRKIVSLIQNHSTLGKSYDARVIENTAEEMLKKAKDSSGRAQLARELMDVKSKSDGQQMAEDAYLVGLDIANSDGELEDAEKEVLAKIANLLGVDPSRFVF